MITYKTYQEAKIANPDGAILKSKVRAGVFKLESGKECMSNWCGCDPSDYCMTIGAFLHSGYKFVVGDICINTCGLAEDVNSPWSWNAPSKEDSDRYVLKSAALEQQMSDKQEAVLATEMSERDIPDFEGMAGVFDACASNEIDDDVKGVEINANGTSVSFDLIDNTPQQVDSLRTTTKPDNNKEISDCVKSIASQLGLTFGVDVGYADLPYKLAARIAGLKVDGAVDAVAGGWDGKGIPPVGVECEILDAGGESTLGVGEIYLVDGRKVFILSKGIKDYPGESVIVGFNGDINLYVMWVNDDDNRFRKIESPQEKAKRELTAFLWGIKIPANASKLAELIVASGFGYRKGE